MGPPQDRRKPLLIVAYFFPPENTSGAARPYRFYNYLPEFGYTPHVLTSSPQDPSRPLPNVQFIPGMREVDKTKVSGYVEAVLRKFVLSGSENVTWIPKAIQEGLRGAPPGGYCAVLSTSPPATPHFVAMRIAQKLKIPWIADFRDPMIGNPFVFTGAWHRQMDEIIEPFLFKKADLVIANTSIVEDEWRGRYPSHRQKIRVLWNGYDPEETMEPVASSEVRSCRHLLHTGSLYKKRHPGLLLASVERLLTRGAIQPYELRVELIGGVDESDMPVRMASFQEIARHRVLQCDNVTIPRVDALRRIAAADLLLMIDVQDPQAGKQAPAKLFDYLRSGRPILAFTTRNSASDRILQKSGVPYMPVYVDDRPECIDEKMLAFLRMPAVTTRASSWFYENFDGRRQTGVLASMISALIREQ